MKVQKILYWVFLSLFTALMLFSVSNYFFKNEMIRQFFTNFGYPTYLIYPLAVAKLLGLAALWTNVKTLKEWAYAGFFYNVVLAFFAHQQINDGQHMGTVIAMILLLVTYFLGKRVRP